MQISHVNPESYVDGPGRRAVVFLQGCTLACPGCQNKHLWPANGGQFITPDALADALLAANREAVTISGGEPFQQRNELAALVVSLRAKAPGVHIIVYSGYTLDELIDLLPSNLFAAIMTRIDVLVDGRFVRQQDNPLMQYRGSANQRPIDVQATLQSGAVVTLDWDTPEIVITDSGDLLMPIGVREFDELGSAGTTRRCGQTQ